MQKTKHESVETVREREREREREGTLQKNCSTTSYTQKQQLTSKKEQALYKRKIN